MYYESREHKLVNVPCATEAANRIKEKRVSAFDAIRWVSDNGMFYAVSDAHIDDQAFAETAILKHINGKLHQVESITAAWIETAKELADYFLQAEQSNFDMGEASLIVGKATTEKGDFTCGCCGEWFKDSVAKQLTFDQDAGYGICPKCQTFY